MNRVEYNGPIVDTHAFYGQSEAFKVNEPTAPYFDLPEFSNIKFLIMPFSASENESVAEVAENSEKFLGSYLMFNPNEASKYYVEEDKVEEIELASGGEHVVGMKTHPVIFGIPMNDARYFPYYKLAERDDLPVLVHAASQGKDFDSAEMAAEVMERFPDIKLILAHFGGLDPKYMEKAVMLFDSFPNLYLNTTGLDQMGRNRQIQLQTGERTVLDKLSAAEVLAMKRDAQAIVKAAVQIYPSRVLHGSDLGYHLPEDYSFWPLRELKVGEQMQVMFANPQRLFKKLKPF